MHAARTCAHARACAASARCYAQISHGPAACATNQHPFFPCLSGTHMKTSIKHGDVKLLPAEESVTERHLKKMGALLKTYDPDLVQFRGTFKKQARRTAFVFEATLSL